jgi:hypothetical protein
MADDQVTTNVLFEEYNKQQWCRHQGLMGKEINSPTVDLLDPGLNVFGSGRC